MYCKEHFSLLLIWKDSLSDLVFLCFFTKLRLILLLFDFGWFLIFFLINNIFDKSALVGFKLKTFHLEFFNSEESLSRVSLWPHASFVFISPRLRVDSFIITTWNIKVKVSYVTRQPVATGAGCRIAQFSQSASKPVSHCITSGFVVSGALTGVFVPGEKSDSSSAHCFSLKIGLCEKMPVRLETVFVKEGSG